MLPMLATPAPRVPAGDGWAHEVKWDGMRIVAHARGGRVRLTTRDGRDATDRFPELTDVGSGLDEVMLDGEVVDLRDGRPSFSRLVTRIHARGDVAASLARRAPVTFMVFDVLRIGDRDLLDVPLRARRELLDAIGEPGRHARLSPTYSDGAGLLAATRDQGLEGVVSKRWESRYAPGRRSPDWLKSAHRPTVSVVVGGVRPETGDARRVGALLVGLPSPDGSLEFVGRVGSGFGRAEQETLAHALTPLAAAESPFDPPVPALDAAGASWVRPELVVDVRSLGGFRPRTADPDARLRQPVFVRTRPDLGASDLPAGAEQDGEDGDR